MIWGRKAILRVHPSVSTRCTVHVCAVPRAASQEVTLWKHNNFQAPPQIAGSTSIHKGSRIYRYMKHNLYQR